MQGYLGAGADILGSLSDMHVHGLCRTLTSGSKACCTGVSSMVA